MMNICSCSGIIMLMFLPMLYSLRLPKWLYNPPVLTMVPLVPPLDLGRECLVGGVGGVCYTRAKCEGMGLHYTGHCTRDKSVCCTEVSSCNSSLVSRVSYLTSGPHPVSSCQATVDITPSICYLRLKLEDWPGGVTQDKGGGCISLSSQEEGSPRVERTGLLCGLKTGLEMVMPVMRGSQVFLTVDDGEGSWTVKMVQEECSPTREEEPGKGARCSSRRDSRREVKSLVRRRKKQLFSDRRRKRKENKRKKKKRQRRSLLEPFSWVFGHKSEEKEPRTANKLDKSLKVHTLLEIAGERVKSVPSDFFAIAASSDMQLSQFSGQQGLVERRRRKRQNKSKATAPWAGVVSGYPAYLVSPRHALSPGTVQGDTAVFPGYRVTIGTITLLCDIGCSLAIITLHHPLHSVPVLCHPLDYVDTLLGVSSTTSTRDYVAQLIARDQ